MQKAIAGFFRTAAEGDAARKQLLDGGFSQNEVSFIVGDTRTHETPAIGPVDEVGAEHEAARDAWIGGVAGLAVGMVSVLIPGIGPLLAYGPIAGAIGGLGVGAAAGGLVGLLKDYGISEEEARFYEKGVKEGGALLTVHGVSDDRADDARKILDRAGAIKVEDLVE